jgi:hypothetical protein
MIPVLSPSGVQEVIDFGLHGWAMSRYSGCWVSIKAISDTIESSAVVDISPERFNFVIPQDFPIPEGGLSIRWPDPPLVQEKRVLHHRLYAALAYARANKLNHITLDSPKPRLGIITCGKSYLDVMQALDDLGIDEAWPPTSACASSRWAWCGRWSRKACATLPKGWMKSWWWKKNARSSNTSSRNSCTTGATTYARAWWASLPKKANGPCRTATGCCRLPAS